MHRLGDGRLEPVHSIHVDGSNARRSVERLVDRPEQFNGLGRVHPSRPRVRQADAFVIGVPVGGDGGRAGFRRTFGSIGRALFEVLHLANVGFQLVGCSPSGSRSIVSGFPGVSDVAEPVGDRGESRRRHLHSGHPRAGLGCLFRMDGASADDGLLTARGDSDGDQGEIERQASRGGGGGCGRGQRCDLGSLRVRVNGGLPSPFGCARCLPPAGGESGERRVSGAFQCPNGALTLNHRLRVLVRLRRFQPTLPRGQRCDLAGQLLVPGIRLTVGGVRRRLSGHHGLMAGLGCSRLVDGGRHICGSCGDHRRRVAGVHLQCSGGIGCGLLEAALLLPSFGEAIQLLPRVLQDIVRQRRQRLRQQPGDLPVVDTDADVRGAQFVQHVQVRPEPGPAAVIGEPEQLLRHTVAVHGGNVGHPVGADGLSQRFPFQRPSLRIQKVQVMSNPLRSDEVRDVGLAGVGGVPEEGSHRHILAVWIPAFRPHVPCPVHGRSEPDAHQGVDGHLP